MSDQPAQDTGGAVVEGTFTEKPIESNPQPEFDTSAALAEISSDLFGQGSEDGAASAEGAESPDGSQATVETPPTEGENSEAVVETGAPSTWTKEALQEWAAIPPRAQQEILKREEDMMRGIEQYKGAADLGQKYDSVVEPFKPLLTAENVDPVQLFQSFASNHYLLTRGSPEQKVELAAQMLGHYGVDLGNLLDYIGNNAISPPDPRVVALEREVAQLRNQTTQSVAAATEQQRATILSEVEKFAADPAHPYFNEVIDHIGKLMETGVATTLSEAYETAVYANPVTRQKEVDRLTAEKTASRDAAEKARLDKLRKSSAADVDASAQQRNGTIPTGSMDDTLNQTLASINSRG